MRMRVLIREFERFEAKYELYNRWFRTRSDAIPSVAASSVKQNEKNLTMDGFKLKIEPSLPH